MTLSKTVSNLMRTQEILYVFFRHGFGGLLQRMGLSQYVKSGQSHEQGEAAHTEELVTDARRFRDALEELGGAFVKLGQLLSTRPDMVPKNWIEELVPLQDDVAPVEFDVVKKTVVSDLGPLEENFLFIDPTPMAAGSIAQVHRGVTLNREEVVVKIRRPGVKQTVLQDCDILQAFAELMERHVPEARNYQPVKIVEQFRNAVTGEMDFTEEAHNLDRFRSYFSDRPYVVFPKPFWDQTTERVLTMERLVGIKISLIDQLRGEAVDTPRIARILAEAILRQILEHGFLHGDPHPGNLMVVDKTRVGFLDCGMVGHLDERMQENLVLLVAAGLRRDTDILTDILIDMNALPGDLDRDRFRKEADLFLDRYYRLPLKKIRLTSIIHDAVGLINKYKIQVPSDLLMVGKALITLEGTGRNLDPDFDAVATAEPFIKEMVLTSYGPSFIGRKIIQGSRDVLRLLRELPGDLRGLSRTLRDNQLRVAIDHRGLKEAFQELDRASKRVSTSIIIASIVLGSSLIILSSSEPRFKGIPVLGIAGYGIAAALALWLIIATMIKGKP